MRPRKPDTLKNALSHRPAHGLTGLWLPVQPTKEAAKCSRRRPPMYFAASYYHCAGTTDARVAAAYATAGIWRRSDHRAASPCGTALASF